MRADNDPAILLLHHFGGSSRTWEPVLRLLGDDVDCHAPDLRGFGRSAPDGRGYRIDDYADDIAAFIRENGLTRFVLVGHSMGGKIALALAARRPVGLQSLVLLAPSPPTPEPIPDDDRRQLMQARDDVASATRIAQRITARPLTAEDLERVVDDILRSAPRAWRAWLDHGSREDIASSMSRIDVPVLVVAGGCDKALGAAVQGPEVVARLRDARLVTVPDVAHLLPVEAPDAIADLLRSVVKTSGPTDPPRRHPPQRPLVNDGQAGPAAAPSARTRYPSGSVLALLPTSRVTPATRRALQSRLDETITQLVFLDAELFAILRAVCDRLIPQHHRASPIDLAGAIDRQLATGDGNGWRYAVMPPDGEAYREGLREMNAIARAAFAKRFVELDPPQQDELLAEIQRGVPGHVWRSVPPRQFFEELLADVVDVYYSHPLAQEEIGYVGMADAYGWQKIALDQQESQAPRPVEAIHA